MVVQVDDGPQDDYTPAKALEFSFDTAIDHDA